MNAAVVSIEDRPAEADLVFRYQIPAKLAEVAGLRDTFMVFLNDACVGGDERSTWGLVFSEALSNAIRHGCQMDELLSVAVE